MTLHYGKPFYIASLFVAVLLITLCVQPCTFRQEKIQTVNGPKSTPVLSSLRAEQSSASMDQLSSPETWKQIFSFVPNGLDNCTDLFSDHSKSMSAFFPKQYIDAARLHAKEFTKVHVIKEGFSANYLEQIMVYWKIAQAPFVKTVCETGFNGGHSALLWLSANPRVHVYSFDIGMHAYARPMAKFLQQLFPGRLNVTWGDSTKTLPAFRANYTDILCDIIVVDGGHTEIVANTDMFNFKQMAAHDNILVYDDFPATAWNFMQILGPVWEKRKQTGEIIETFACSYRKGASKKHGFSVGRFNI